MRVMLLMEMEKHRRVQFIHNLILLVNVSNIKEQVLPLNLAILKANDSSPCSALLKGAIPLAATSLQDFKVKFGPSHANKGGERNIEICQNAQLSCTNQQRLIKH